MKHFAHTTNTPFIKPGCLYTDVGHDPDQLELNLPMSHFLEAPLYSCVNKHKGLGLKQTFRRAIVHVPPNILP